MYVIKSWHFAIILHAILRAWEVYHSFQISISEKRGKDKFESLSFHWCSLVRIYAVNKTMLMDDIWDHFVSDSIKFIVAAFHDPNIFAHINWNLVYSYSKLRFQNIRLKRGEKTVWIMIEVGTCVIINQKGIR